MNLNITIGEGKQPFALESFIGQRTAVLGVSGSGKSNTVAVLAEEFAQHIPISVIDPDGEMYSLRDVIDNLLVVGRSENVDIEIQPHQAADIAKFSVENRINIVVDLYEYDEDERNELANAYARGLFEACKAQKPRRPYQVIVEEAHIFIPQPSTLKSVWKQVALRGRKLGLGVVLASQRSQMVDKDVLTQCSVKILHQVEHPRDIGVYKDLIPLSSKEVEEEVNRIKTGEAIAIYRDEYGTQTETRQIRKRHSFHAGATPGLDDDYADPEVKRPLPDVALALNTILRASARVVIDPEIERRDKEIKSLKEQLALSESLIADLQKAEVATKDYIKKLNERIETIRLIRVQCSNHGEQIACADNATAQEPAAGQRKQAPAVYQRQLLEMEQSYSDRKSPMDETLVLRQHTSLTGLCKRIQLLRRSDKLMLQWFLANPVAETSLEELTPLLGYEGNTLVSNPPSNLINMGFVQRVGKRGNFRYRSQIMNYAQNKFPNLGVEHVCSVIERAIT